MADIVPPPPPHWNIYPLTFLPAVFARPITDDELESFIGGDDA